MPAKKNRVKNRSYKFWIDLRRHYYAPTWLQIVVWLINVTSAPLFDQNCHGECQEKNVLGYIESPYTVAWETYFVVRKAYIKRLNEL